MRASYTIGDVARITATFQDNGVPAIPATVVARALSPASSVSTYVYGGLMVAVGTGAYQFDVELDESGEWWIRVEGLDTHPAAEEFHIYVRPSHF